MPCYDPPPEWAGDERRNAEQAARILCERTLADIRSGKSISQEQLEWFVRHKEIDIRIAESNYFKEREPELAEEHRQIMERAKSLLKG